MLDGESKKGYKWLNDLGRIAQLGEHRPYKPRVTGSNPVSPTKLLKGS